MINLKRGLYIISVFIISSCNNLSNKNSTNQPPAFKQPVIQPIKFSKPKKINWDAIVTAHIQPQFHNLDFKKLPTETYDTTDYKPFSKPVEQATLNFKALPTKNLDIDLLPAKPLKFKTYILAPPKLIKRGPLARVNSSQLIYDFGDIPGPQGNSVSCLYTDHDGFLWFATFQGGLFRYDGENLQQYLPGPLDYSIDCILQDKQGQIWISEFGGGISVLDIKNGIIKKTGVAQGLNSDKPNRMMIDNEQRIWVTYSTGGVDILDTQLSIVKFLGKENGLSTTVATVSTLEDDKGNIWISSLGGGLNIIDPVNKKIKYLDKAHGLKSDSLTWLVNDRTNHVWAGFADGVLSVLGSADNTIQNIREAQLPKTFATCLFVNDDGKVWCGTNSGLYVFDLNKRLVRTIKQHDGLSNALILRMDKDNNGHIWIATNGGLNAVNVRKTVTEHIGNAGTASVFEDKNGLIWQGTNNGVYIVNRKNKTIRHLSKLQGLYNDTVQTIREIQGEVFICTNNGLDIVDSAHTSIAHFGTEEGFTNKLILSTAADKKNRLWIGGDQDGLDVLDLGDLSLKHIGKARGLSNGQNIDDIKLDKRGRIWVSTRIGGVNVIDPDTWTIKSVNAVNGVKMLQADDSGNMWIGTAKGILIANAKDDRLISFSTPQGLVDERVISLINHNGKMYAGTNKGVSEITLPVAGVTSGDGWKARSFGEANGIIKRVRGNWLTDIITRDNYFCMGDSGLIMLNLSRKSMPAPQVYISGLNVMDEPGAFMNKTAYDVTGKDTLWFNEDISYTSGQHPETTGYTSQSGIRWDSVKTPYNIPVNLHVRYDQNFIQFQFNTLNLAKHDTTWYRYRLLGLDKDWNQLTNLTNSRNYFSLAPGEYTFEVSGKTIDRDWTAPARLSFTIDPPWWQKWWAYLIYLGVFAGLVWGFTHVRALQLVKDKRRLEQKITERTEEVMQQKEEIETQRDHLEKMVDELKVAQSQLVQSEKLASLGELTAAIAHEIQNPLNFVNNFSEVSIEMLSELKEAQQKENRDLEDEKELFDTLEQNLDKIQFHGKRADGIVKTMLQHSRNNSSEREPTDINALTDEYMRLSYHGLRAKDKSFNAGMLMDQGNKIPKLNVVPQEVGRVMLNIFNNAFYAVHQKSKLNIPKYQPQVTLSTRAEKGFVSITVKDNGSGIPDSIKDKIMQPFFTTKPTGEGTGLGLSLSHDIIVKGYGGDIRINSKEGEFTEFTVMIPV